MSNKIKELQDIMKEVKCPIGAMKIEGGELVCRCPSALYKNVGKLSLGDIRLDILDNCNECKSALKKEEEEKDNGFFKSLEISEYQEVNCPAESSSVSAIEGCKGCAFFNREAFAKQMKDQGEEAEMKTITCGFPRINKENMKVFTDKKIVKEAVLD